ncbi:Lrp/AsnC ligand binding domain-containing protein [Pseudoalteromonas sp. SS15]|uniref:Lrp/AsnC ligand binding domain-containing protein n=1 Tax=Pseudoalteromonas sp. SS15 TaxID=3139393 RepID=UPI003BACF13D
MATNDFEFVRDNGIHRNVLSCHNTTGDADFLLQVVAKDLDDYSNFIDSVLRKLKGISGIKSSLSLKELKSSSRLPI